MCPLWPTTDSLISETWWRHRTCGAHNQQLKKSWERRQIRSAGTRTSQLELIVAPNLFNGSGGELRTATAQLAMAGLEPLAAKKRISQQTFDETVRENVDDFEMVSSKCYVAPLLSRPMERSSDHMPWPYMDME